LLPPPRCNALELAGAFLEEPVTDEDDRDADTCGKQGRDVGLQAGDVEGGEEIRDRVPGSEGRSSDERGSSSSGSDGNETRTDFFKHEKTPLLVFALDARG
jgi:hypothetical protein